jgi:peptide/nickel transport system substrate-binding protein
MNGRHTVLEPPFGKHIDRRSWLTLAAGGVASACSPTTATGIALPDIPRHRTLHVMNGTMVGRFGDTGVGNPYHFNATHYTGHTAVWEPLFYFSAVGPGMIPWLALDFTYRDDARELTVRLRDGVRWGDGKPFTARDVAFTLLAVAGSPPTVAFSQDLKAQVRDAFALDPLTLVVRFVAPSPRFLFDYLTFKYDTGLKILPEHVFRGRKLADFDFYDPGAGWPFGTGPYRVAAWTDTWKFLDRRDDWWGSQVQFADLPGPERIVVVPYADENRLAMGMTRGEIDHSWTMVHSTARALVGEGVDGARTGGNLDGAYAPAGKPQSGTALSERMALMTYSFGRPPYGNVDWWPLSLWFDTRVPPFNDARLRWAISFAIDRRRLVDVGQEGFGEPTALPYPSFRALEPYLESVRYRLWEFPSNRYAPREVAKRMEVLGYRRDGAGFWARDGERLQIPIVGHPQWADLGPVLAELLRLEGFDAKYDQPPDWLDRIRTGRATAWIYGHGASVVDPHFTLTLFHGRNASAESAAAGGAGGSWSRWSDPAFDRIVDQMNQVPVGDRRMLDLFPEAMDVWLRDLPNVPLVQSFHHNVMSQVYWVGWPSILNPYVNDAFWHLTWPLVLRRLKPVR